MLTLPVNLLQAVYIQIYLTLWNALVWQVKFIYSEKATNFCEIFTVDFSYVVMVKSTVQNI